ncbi:MAG: N-acetyl-gamma-glutamyl-phosphate reductase [Chloroflexi bacterium]|nr:MAG: N-acetyl-gamma-glutamyl-phosphate reductase [Chloroflexota bacterium]
MIRAGIFGATGYTGFELVKILAMHAQVEISFATSQSYAGKLLSNLYPAAPDLPLISGSDAPLAETDAVFLCLPHAAAAETAVTALAAGCRVIDLSADFRIKDENTYNNWYDHTHPAPHLLAQAVYGLTEFAREQLPAAQLVANPGCYPTSVLMALKPLLDMNIPLTGPIIADSKSGVSGAGRAPKQNTHFVEVTNNFSPYKIGRTHRHLPEMEQAIGWWHDNPPQLIFSPHLLPVPRGILSTIYVSLVGDVDEGMLREEYGRFYANEPFVKVLPAGQLSTLAHVVHTNHCVISLTLAGSTLILTSAIDNLVKGAAGQAVQNMNVMFELEETSGLI